MPAPPPPAQPLGRSLIPLPDESLPGFVLRLAHRLELPPARIAALAGLPAAGSNSSRPLAHAMLTLDPHVTARFAQVTRLNPEEVAGLCMDRYASRYPALDLTTRSPVPRVMAISRRGWVLMHSTRYCPQCLAGDGSLIQQRHGGPWQQRWRLQVVFACTTHQRLLEHQCHRCGTPALLSRSGSNVTLLPRANDKDLHPAQCRSHTSGPCERPAPAICGARLDTPAVLTPPLPPGLLRLQDQILERLEPAGPVPPARAQEYFRLLSLVHNLIMLSWPRARHLAGPEQFATAAGTHVATARQAVEQAKAAAAARPFTFTEIHPPMRKLPLACDACAGLLLAADTLLGWDDPAGLPDRLMPLTQAAALDPQAWYWLRTHPAWPPAVRRSFLPHLKGFTIPARRTGRPLISPRQCQFQPENVPQRLPSTWSDRHLAHLTGISSKHLHRAAALKLVELASGHPWSQAAELLRLPRRNAELAVFSTRRWMRDDRNQEAFDHAIEALASELDAISPHVNYVIRRRAIQTWAMPDAHWQGFFHELETQTTHGRGRLDTISERRRQVISVLIWTHITHSEHLFAPAVLADKAHATAPGTARLAAQACEVLRNNNGYTALRTIINDYAGNLARNIDRTGTADNFNWNPPTPLTTQPAPRDQRHRNALCRKPRS